MNRQLLLMLGCMFLLAGWLAAFLLRYIPQTTDYYWLLPTLLLAVGMGMVSRLESMRMTAVILALTAVCAIIAINLLYPRGAVSLKAFRENLQVTTTGARTVSLKVTEQDREGPFAQPRQLTAYTDLRVELFAKLPGSPRMLCFDPAGNLYVSLPELGAIYLLRDTDGDGRAERPLLFRHSLDRPHGLAWHAGSLYVAEPERLLRLTDRDGDQTADQLEVLLTGLPDDGGHWTRSLALGGDGYLYLSIGSRCNACEEDDPRRASILRVDPRSGKSEPFASGLRNAVGLTFDPAGEEFWATDNGRDLLGDDLPPDELNLLRRGQDYGWPYCFGKQIPDPDLGTTDRCARTVPSSVDFQAHSAPLGLTFGSGLQAPERYRQSLYVAYHGSWNRSVPTGYKLIRIPFENGRPAGPATDLLEGWLRQGKAWGRPVAPLVGPDGSLYLSDDRADAVYRIRWPGSVP